MVIGGGNMRIKTYQDGERLIVAFNEMTKEDMVSIDSFIKSIDSNTQHSTIPSVKPLPSITRTNSNDKQVDKESSTFIADASKSLHEALTPNNGKLNVTTMESPENFKISKCEDLQGLDGLKTLLEMKEILLNCTGVARDKLRKNMMTKLFFNVEQYLNHIGESELLDLYKQCVNE